ASDRRTPAAPGRTPRRAFFSPPHQPDNAHLRITEHPTNRRHRANAREAIRILQSSSLAHRQFMPNFSASIKLENPWPTRLSTLRTCLFHPLEMQKTQFFVSSATARFLRAMALSGSSLRASQN